MQSYKTIQQRDCAIHRAPVRAWIMSVMEGTASDVSYSFVFGVIGVLWAVISLSVI